MKQTTTERVETLADAAELLRIKAAIDGAGMGSIVQAQCIQILATLTLVEVLSKIYDHLEARG